MQLAWYNRISFMNDFFNDNLYQHQKFGIADIIVLFLVSSLFIYAMSFTESGKNFKKWRAESGYIINAGFTLAVTSIHSVKWSLSRARPGSIVICFQEKGASAGLSINDINKPEYSGQIQNMMQGCVDTWHTAWYMPGALTSEMGFNKGSFPSGHVATMGVLMTAFFLLPKMGVNSFLRWSFFAFVLGLELLMGYHRMTSDTHWLTDNMASVYLSIAIAYGYYHFLHFPVRTDDVLSHRLADSLENRKPGWEFMLLLTTLFFFYSGAAVVVGIREIAENHIQKGSIMIVAGGALAVIFAELAFRVTANRGLIFKYR
jgi:membrane-associated phospholipid phosphatase